MRLAMAAFVVIGHSGAARDTIGMADLAAGNTLLRVAVPVFTLIAGFYAESMLRRGDLSKWSGRLLAQYGGWSLIYLVFLATYFLNRSGVRTFEELVLGFMHLWFLMGLALAGMMLAFFRRFGPFGVAASAIGFAAAGFFIQHARMAWGMELDLELYRNGPFYLYPYLAMGWLLARVPAERLPSTPVLGIAFGVGMALAMYQSGYWLQRLGEDPLLEMPFGHLLMCPALFLLVLRLPLPETRLPLGRAAAGIYVMHVLVLQGLPWIGIDTAWIRAVIAFAVPFMIVAVTVSLSARMPFLSRLF
ncbi:acyltransferase family protein [Paracoccus zeaxanthinifaciens]|uniref:acyltransferase family protein n=1 Tax=Paracoccus zeaxanthinifaciens TaxID=187400 RepID=UPI0003B3B36A|nr:acyltransferase family protein [Paracoccus zeaxanthinifaciens]